VRKNLFWSSLIFLLTFSLFSVNMIRISIAQVNHDVAVISVTPSATSVRLGNLVNITVVVKNKGTAAENFTVTLSYDTTAIETRPVTNLAASLNSTLVFTWNTTDRREEIYATDEKEKTYTIKAEASTLPGETNTQDNTLASPSSIRVISYYIAVIPQRTVDLTITPGMNYTVSIYTDYNGSDVWSWQFTLSYRPSVLEGIEVCNGDLITTAKNPNATFTAGKFNNTIGKLSLTGAYFAYTSPPPPTTSGPGTLAYVTFRVKSTGESNITLIEKETKLLGPNAAPIIDYILPFFDHIIYGYFRNTEIQVIHDIAVISVTPSPTSVIAGELVNITVVVENQGTGEETFDVNVYYDYDQRFPGQNVIQTKTVQSLTAGAEKTLIFTWDTTNVKGGSHTITAVVPEVSGELDKTDNLKQGQEVIVKAREAQPLPITELIIGIVIVVAVIAAIALVRKRRKKPLPEQV